MNEKWLQGENENRINYIKRITNFRNEYGMKYSDWCSLITDGATYGEDTSRKAYYIVNRMLPLIGNKEELDDETLNKINELDMKEIQVRKEQMKYSDIKREYYNLVRTESRWEVLFDGILRQMENMDYNYKLNITPYKINGEETEAVLCLSDWHIGVNINSPINKYNIEIAHKRMNKLINDTIKHCKNNNVKKLHIVLMGDLIHGTIHVSARLHQNEVVTNQVLIASEMMTTLIATLSQVVGEVEVYNANGNHGRVSANVKESISEENFETFIYEYVKLKTEIIKLKEDICNNVNFNENEFEDIVLIDINNHRIALTHGHNDFKQLNKAKDKINELLMNYRADELIIGHLHNVRMHDGITVNGSMSGSDDHAMKGRYNSDPSQILKIYYNDNSVLLCDMKLGRE